MPSGSDRIDRAAARLARFVATLSAAGLVVMTAVTAWQVFARYVLNDSPPWSEAAALVIMAYFVLLAGELMNQSGIAEKLVRLAESLLGRLKGGLGHVSVLSCMRAVPGLPSAAFPSKRAYVRSGRSTLQ